MSNNHNDGTSYHIRVRGRITGPYDFAQLAKLRGRGQFSRANEVSTDRGKTWQSAALIEDLFSNTSPSKSVNNNNRSELALEETEWYFVDGRGAEKGPLSKSQIVEIANIGEINNRTLLFRNGDVDWKSAEEIPFLREIVAKRSSWRFSTAFIAAVAIGIIVAIGVPTLLIVINKPKPAAVEPQFSSLPSTSETPEEPVDSPLQIRSLADEVAVAGALGRTVCSERVTLANGSIIETPKSHGTAFAITKTGYFLTNRHVVEELASVRDSELKIGDSNIRVRIDEVVYLFLGKLRFPAKVVHTSSRFDMAILKINRIQPQRYFVLSEQSNVNRRTEVVALGFPGLASKAIGEESKMLDERFTSHFVEALKAKCTVNVETLMPESAFAYSAEDGKTSRIANDTAGTVQVFHSAKIFPGNSGGPLVNSSAAVIGINTLFLRDISKIGDQIVTGDNIYIALAIGQMRNEIAEHVPDPVDWVKE